MLSRTTSLGPLLMAMAIFSRMVDASIYQRYGKGQCEPAQGEAYSFMKTYGIINTAACSEACDSVSAHDPIAFHHYRGFGHVKRAIPELGLHRGDCVCYFDCHHLRKR